MKRMASPQSKAETGHPIAEVTLSLEIDEGTLSNSVNDGKSVQSQS